jgi:hypothetical protein
MQSTAILTMAHPAFFVMAAGAIPDCRYVQRKSVSGSLFVVFGFEHFATTVKTVGADVVTQVHFTVRCCGQGCAGQGVVRTVHATLGWGFLVLLNGHDDST